MKQEITKSLRLLSMLACLLMTIDAWSQPIQEAWARRYQGPDTSIYSGYRVTVDGAGNAYVVGTIEADTASVDASRDVKIITIKYDPRGNIVWKKTFDDRSRPSGIELDKNGNLYIGGTYYGNSSSDVLLIKYDANGNLVWTSMYDGPAHRNDHGGELTIDTSGNIFMCGTVQEANDFESDVVTIKYAPTGTRLWAKTYDGFAHFDDQPFAIAVPGDGFVYVGGYANRNGNSNPLIIKYTTAGVEVWTRTYFSAQIPGHYISDLAVDKAGNICATGAAYSEAEDQNFFTVKYDAAGNVKWAKQYHNTDRDYAIFIGVDGNNNLIVTGNSANNTHPNMLTIKYDPQGNELWTRRFNSEANCHSAPYDMLVDKQDNIYVVGYTRKDNCSKGYFVTQKYDSEGLTSWSKLWGGPGEESVPYAMAVDAKGRVYVTGRSSDGEITAGGDGQWALTTVKYALCLVNPPANITVNNETGKCGATVTYPAATTTGTCGSLTYSQASGTFFPVGTTEVIVSSASSGESASFTITVKDVEAPKITCPASVTVSCAADVPAVDLTSVTATDNCSTINITHVGDVITNKICANRFTLTRTYKATDGSGNSAACEQLIIVNDTIPPKITGLSLTQYTLWPANHRMRDIAVNYTVSDNCVGNPNVTVTVTSNEPVNGTGDGDTDPDWQVVDLHNIKLRAERAATGNGRIYTVTVTVDDGCNPPVSESKSVFVAHNITGPKSGMPFKVGSTVSLNGVFWDKAGNTHTAKWLLDGSALTNGTVTEPSGMNNGKVTGSYKFNTPGVYKLQMNVTDQSGVTSYSNMNNDLDAIVVIYDPNGGYAYGGGYFDSQSGALVADATATGKASFGFAVNYANPAKPKGETQFEFKVGSFEFNALNFDYLALNNAKAQFKGTGKIIGGQSGIGFIMTVIDGELDGTGVDKIRMKIYNRNTGVVYYDNQPGATDADDPSTATGLNSEIVIKGKAQQQTTSARVTEAFEVEKSAVRKFDMVVFPNPATSQFSVELRTNDLSTKVMMQVFDMQGRMVEQRSNLSPSTKVNFGNELKPGSYLVKVIQGQQRAEKMLIKL